MKILKRANQSGFCFAVILSLMFATVFINVSAVSKQGSGTALSRQDLYLDPSANNPVSAYVTSYISQNDTVSIYFKENGWYYIGYQGSSWKRGYVPVSSITTTATITGNTYVSWSTTTSGGQNRDIILCPETTTKIGTVYGTDTITVIGEEANHYYVQYLAGNGYKRGYINKSYVTVSNTAIDLAIVNTPSNNIANGAFSVSVKATGGTRGISYVRFHAWTTAGGQDDITKVNGVKMEGTNIWSYTVNPAEHKNENGNYNIQAYAYDATGSSKVIDLPAVGINTVTHTYQVVQYGTSGSGQKLYYYSIKPKVVTAKTQKLLAGFAIHGWEDSYAKDGQVLVDIGNTVADYFASNQTQLYNFELIIIPRMNPDGLDYGTTNNGPGRCQTSLGIDINRDFDTNFVAQTDPRNKTGSVPFGSPEAKAIRDLIVAQKPSIVLDFHGWLDKTIGDPQLAKIIGDTMGITSTSQFTTGFNGYFAPWAGKYSQRTMLVEYPVSCALGSKAAYITKTQNALSKIMQTYSVMEPLPVITIDPYNTAPTNQNITVTARTDKGSLNRTSYTFTENGSFEFIANDGGSISKRTVTITNIDKKAPVVSGVSDGKSYQAPVRITFSDGAATLNGQAFVSGTTVAQNGSYSLTVTDAVGNKTIINFEIRNRGYELIDNILCGINPKTTVADLKSALTKEAWQDIILRNKDGKEITGGLVGTGMTLHMTRNEETMDCTILIYGDIDGNGLVDAIDMVYIKKHTLKIKRLTGLTLEAADTSHDGTVNVTDLVKMKTHLLKRAFISQYRNEKEILNP